MKLGNRIGSVNLMVLAMMGVVLQFCLPARADDAERPDWRSHVGECAQDEQKFTDMYVRLESDPDEQIEFLRAVNFALAHLPGSIEEKTAKMLSINRTAALKAPPPPENKCAVVAETFATLPIEALAVIHERYAQELFDRSKEGAPKTDEEFEKQAKTLLSAVRKRCARATAPGTHGVERTGGFGGKDEDIMPAPGIRTTLAVLMMLKASGGNSKELREALMPYIETGSHVIAREEWIPAAMGDDENKEKTLDPILKVGERGEEPDHEIVISMAPIQSGVWLMGEHWIGKSWDVSGSTI